jgi:hypothetical protein
MTSTTSDITWEALTAAGIDIDHVELARDGACYIYVDGDTKIAFGAGQTPENTGTRHGYDTTVYDRRSDDTDTWWDETAYNWLPTVGELLAWIADRIHAAPDA